MTNPSIAATRLPAALLACVAVALAASSTVSAQTPAAPAATPVAPSAAPAPAPIPLPPQKPFDLKRTEIRGFIDEVSARHGIPRAELVALLGQAVAQPKIIEAMTRPAERISPWWEYSARFLTEQRIREGADFWAQHRERLEKIERETGVAAPYVVAIIGVETFYGRIKGSWRVLDALMTLGFDYPPRAKFFRSELEQFLLLAREEKLDPLTALGSYAGAMGAPQFIPSSYRRYAVDGGDDGSRNLFDDWDDVVASVANYFKVHGWQAGAPVLVEAQADPSVMATLDPRNLRLNDTVGSLRGRGIVFETSEPAEAAAILLPAELQDRPNVRIGFRNFEVITRYNRSIRYAMAVHDLAQAISARATAADR
ncbi:MAG: lytic murein transglycosylase B [Steroidobacteraceae bacterium]|nr:lytic murein transglycosylase B [Nevskiaceae bacterium]MCP5360502.1 lytic murein transglycosylase B [Nevskiaceae bacterium]MCP5472848.1 lytic murein transglycosylase B [Nevskiaceae bacterium]